MPDYTPSFLVDTHVLIWLDQNPDRLSAHILGLLRDPQHEVYCSVASLWEIAIQQNLGELEVHGPFTGMLEQYGFAELAVTARDAETVRTLPLHHRDPFDRMLVAQATTRNLVLVSGDRQMLAYEVAILSC